MLQLIAVMATWHAFRALIMDELRMFVFCQPYYQWICVARAYLLQGILMDSYHHLEAFIQYKHGFSFIRHGH